MLVQLLLIILVKVCNVFPLKMQLNNLPANLIMIVIILVIIEEEFSPTFSFAVSGSPSVSSPLIFTLSLPLNIDFLVGVSVGVLNRLERGVILLLLLLSFFLSGTLGDADGVIIPIARLAICANNEFVNTGGAGVISRNGCLVRLFVFLFVVFLLFGAIVLMSYLV